MQNGEVREELAKCTAALRTEESTRRQLASELECLKDELEERRTQLKVRGGSDCDRSGATPRSCSTVGRNKLPRAHFHLNPSSGHRMVAVCKWRPSVSMLAYLVLALLLAQYAIMLQSCRKSWEYRRVEQNAILAAILCAGGF